MSSATGLLFVSPTGTTNVPVVSQRMFLATCGLSTIPVPATSVIVTVCTRSVPIIAASRTTESPAT